MYIKNLRNKNQQFLPRNYYYGESFDTTINLDIPFKSVTSKCEVSF